MSATRQAGWLISLLALTGVAGCAETAIVGVGSSAPKGVYAPTPAAPMPEPSPAASAEVAKDGANKKTKEADRDGDGVAERDRPGLGTEWGETRRSEISMVSFDRQSPDRPAAVGSLFYNDDAGARALAGGAWTGSPASFAAARGAVQIGLRDDGGQLFPGFVSGGKDVVVGEAGRRYTIVVHSNVDRRLEIVLSVDGLDVRDGQTASFAKRGYILDPHAELDIDGFRRSETEVAAFRFGSVRGSYAGQKYGDTRNVGVIGLAVFPERGSLPLLWTAEEVRRRREANPFPGELPQPPGG